MFLPRRRATAGEDEEGRRATSRGAERMTWRGRSAAGSAVGSGAGSEAGSDAGSDAGSGCSGRAAGAGSGNRSERRRRVGARTSITSRVRKTTGCRSGGGTPASKWARAIARIRPGMLPAWRWRPSHQRA